MAGRKGRGNLPGRKRLRAALDKALQAATSLDLIDEGAGDAFCVALADVVSAQTRASIRNSDRKSASEPIRAAY